MKQGSYTHFRTCIPNILINIKVFINTFEFGVPLALFSGWITTLQWTSYDFTYNLLHYRKGPHICTNSWPRQRHSIITQILITAHLSIAQNWKPAALLTLPQLIVILDQHCHMEYALCFPELIIPWLDFLEIGNPGWLIPEIPHYLNNLPHHQKKEGFHP